MTNNDNFTKMYSIEYEEEHDRFVIGYDDKLDLIYNEKYIINMDNDYVSDNNMKRNMMWIDYIKKHYNWKNGDVIYLNQKQNCDNWFYVKRGWFDIGCYIMVINGDGSVSSQLYDYKLDCIYNDKLNLGEIE
jgi:hypothetical protein